MLPELTFHHIGIAVYDIEKTAIIYENAGYKRSSTIFDEIQNVKICFLEKEGMPQIELLEPVNEDSPVVKILDKNGVSPYHICYEVTDIDESVRKLKKQRYIVVVKPVKAVAIENRKVCFLFNKEIGLIELVEQSK